MVIAILSVFGFTTKFLAVPATNITLEPDRVNEGDSVMLYVPALVDVVRGVLIAILPLNPPPLMVTVLCPAVNVWAELNEESDEGK